MRDGAGAFLTKGGNHDQTAAEAATAAKTETATRRLPERKRVTAIAGLNYLNGILMLADTEESLGEGAKSECNKLYRFSFPNGAVMTGGAGTRILIQCANQEMQTFLPLKRRQAR